ncbi:MAG: acyltransferase [Porticoccaceae bacterium]
MIKLPPNIIRTLLGRCAVFTSLMRRVWVVVSHANVSLEQSVSIGRNVVFKVTDGGRVKIAKNVSVSRGVDIHVQSGELLIGRRSFIGSWTVIVARVSIRIGDDCLIAERVTIRDQDHRIHGDPAIPIRSAGMESAPIKIGNDVWIGAGVVILKGTTIGDGAVVAANAVVNRNVAENEIVGGVPARRIGMRKIEGD